MSRRIWLAVALVCSLVVCPVSAYADDGFIGGLQDFVGTRQVEETNPEKDFNDSYKPEFIDLYGVKAVQPDTTQGNIEWVTDAFNRVPYYDGKYRFINVLKDFLGGGNSSAFRALIIKIPLGICFFWWGVRKALCMIMNAWRKGKQSV